MPVEQCLDELLNEMTSRRVNGVLVEQGSDKSHLLTISCHPVQPPILGTGQCIVVGRHVMDVRRSLAKHQILSVQ
jgi:hypothetical protein